MQYRSLFHSSIVQQFNKNVKTKSPLSFFRIGKEVYTFTCHAKHCKQMNSTIPFFDKCVFGNSVPGPSPDRRGTLRHLGGTLRHSRGSLRHHPQGGTLASIRSRDFWVPGCPLYYSHTIYKIKESHLKMS